MIRLGIFARLFSKRRPKPEEKSPRYVRRGMHVRGVNYYNPELINRLEIGERVKLIPEPSNPHDENAVMVFARDEQIGYVPREDTKVFLNAIKQNKNLLAKITNIKKENNRIIVMFEAEITN